MSSNSLYLKSYSIGYAGSVGLIFLMFSSWSHYYSIVSSSHFFQLILFFFLFSLPTRCDKRSLLLPESSKSSFAGLYSLEFRSCSSSSFFLVVLGLIHKKSSPSLKHPLPRAILLFPQFLTNHHFLVSLWSPSSSRASLLLSSTV